MKLKLSLLAALTLGALYLSLFRQRLTWMGDDGFFISGAERIRAGQAPYRDFSVHFTPGSFYVLAAALKILGDTWSTSRLLWILLILVQATGVYLLVHRLTSSILASTLGFLLIVSPAAINPVYNHHHLSTTLALASTWAWWRWLKTGRVAFAMVAGLSDGLVVCVSQNKGALLIGASVLFLVVCGGSRWKERWRLLGGYSVGTAIPVFGLLALLIAQGALGRFIEDSLVFVARDYSKSSMVPYGTTYDPGSGFAAFARWCGTSWYVFGPPIVLTTELILFRRAPRERKRTGLLMLQGWALWGAALHRPDLDHLISVASLSTALLLAQLCSLAEWVRSKSSSRERWIGRAAVGLLAIVSLLSLSGATSRAWRTARKSRFEIVTDGERAWTPSEPLALTVRGLVSHLSRETPAGEPVFVYPHSSLYYRFLDRPNPTRYDLLLEGVVNPIQVEEVTRVLETLRVRFVIVDTTWNRELARVVYPCANLDFQNGQFMEYVRGHYTADLVLPTATLFRRRE